ncbi:MAG: PQQ-binding-like beta-propeller repeat protein [Planctomycetota bacterium]
MTRPRPSHALLAAFTVACSSATERSLDSPVPAPVPNEVVVMGMVHGGHRTPGPFDLERLKELILAVDPDVVLTEIPPHRLGPAAAEFATTRAITEPRVRVFPEYTDALFPLTRELDLELVGCAGWTKSMADARRAKLAELAETHPDETAEMNEAQAAAGRRIAALGDPRDPAVLHTDRYDALVREGLEPYDRHFNDLLGAGGWTNINLAHYGHVADALDARTGQGLRVLVTFGSWHKHFLRDELAKRDDIRLIPMADFLETTHPSPAAWPEFRGSAGRTGSYGVTEIAEPRVRWEYDTGAVIESSAAVVGDTVYVGGHAQRLHALDRDTGAVRWSFDVDGWLRSSPSVADGLVFFGADDNRFYAVDAKTGKERWRFALGEGGEQASPAIVDGVVYFGAFDGHVYALRAETGALVWKRDVGSGVLSSPTVSDGVVYSGTNGGAVVALDAATGEVRWRVQVSDEAVFSSPAVSEGRVLFTSYDGGVYALDARTGESLWRHATGAASFSSPAVDLGVVYVGSNDDHLYALDAETGSVRWRTGLNGAVFSSPAVTDRSVYVGSSDGRLYALDRVDGAVRWSHAVGGEDVNVWTSPSAIQGRLYFGSHAGKVVVLEEAR